MTNQSDGVGEGAAQDVADLSELHPQDVGVQNFHLHRLVFPAPLLMRNTHCGEKKKKKKNIHWIHSHLKQQEVLIFTEQDLICHTGPERQNLRWQDHLKLRRST